MISRELAFRRSQWLESDAQDKFNRTTIQTRLTKCNIHHRNPLHLQKLTTIW